MDLDLRGLYQNIFYDKNGNAKVQGISSPLFYWGIVIKLILGCFLASPYLTELFLPFISHAVNHGDAYNYFTDSKIEFPYPALMEFIFYLPHKIASWVTPIPETANVLSLLLFRITCLVFDFIILLVLLRWLSTHQRKVLIFYWLSPILIYITYVHGQLDVVPIALLIVSLYFLFKDKFVWFSILLALAICTKTSIALALPFVFIYRYRYSRPQIFNVVKEVGAFLFVILAINLLVWSTGYFQMVYNNEVQSRMFTASFSFSQDRVFLIIPALLLVQTIVMYSRKWVSRDLLLLFLAFGFGTLTLFITPMPGWYYWIVPFFIYFIVKFNGEAKSFFVFLNIAFFMYFAIIPNSDFLNLTIWNQGNTQSIYSILSLNALHVNIIFTVLQTALLLFLIVLYQKGIKAHLNRKLFSQPMLIGLSGDSGSGKSTLSEDLLSVFGTSNTTVIRGDDMHKWERGNENWKSITHLNPKANDLNTDLDHIKKLKDGYTIYRQKYNHKNGKFTLPFEIKSNRLVLFEGLHSFYLRSQSNLYDLKIYLDPEDEILLKRKVTRDTEERGKDKEAVIKQIKDREGDSRQFIKSQKELADIIIRPKLIEGNEGLQVTLPAEIPLDGLLSLLSKNSELKIKHEFLENNLQTVEFNGLINEKVVELVATEEFGILSELGINNANWKGNNQGLIQLMVAVCIFNSL